MAEIEIMRAINHENILNIHRLYSDDGFLHCVTDYTARDLHSVIEKGSFSEEIAARVFMKLLGALDHIHSKSIIHGDVKPTKILIGNETTDVYLADFKCATKAKKREQTRWNLRIHGS